MQALRAPTAARMTASMRPVALRAPARGKALPRLPARPTVTVAAWKKDNGDDDRAGLKTLAAAAFAAATLFLVPLDAAEAARSGGRVRGGSGFKSVPRSSAPRSRNGGSNGVGSIRNYNYYSAPPLIGGYGYGMPYGFGGGGLLFGGPSVVVGGGGFFSLIFFLFVASAVVSAFRNASRGGGGNSGDDEDDDF